MTSTYVRFTGDFSGLKSLGYEFQKLYAANYMQWHKEGLRVWRKGSDVTSDKLREPFFSQLVQIMIDRGGKAPANEQHGNLRWCRCYLNTETNELTLDETEWVEWYKAMSEAGKADINFNLWEATALFARDLLPIKELIDQGWLEVVPLNTPENSE